MIFVTFYLPKLNNMATQLFHCSFINLANNRNWTFWFLFTLLHFTIVCCADVVRKALE